MRAERCYTLNEETEIRVGNCFFTRDDLILMYIDSGMDVLSLAKSLHIGRPRMERILDKFNIPRNWHAELTPRHLRVLRFIKYFQTRNKRSPTNLEISKALRLSPGCTNYHLKKLKAHGYVDWKRYSSGTFKLTKKGEGWCRNAHTFNLFCLEEDEG
ncbi:winged helix-turn-helix transcriptional regulator [Heyndrickxia coagulans]|uniref:LexA DNA binding domain-containing protein n=1 Tax=Heyndrickxia coagulans DSM 1 = ATCC 7050 TaxID=1121088 RepID=A0A0B5WRX3_HEYCO|nr:ArsR family transcriptional regulator [Heyndrickxia coagulans]AJH77366.1 bacterial regulatory, arsR family protein [Heyndrickxia coagulans DSM 1 = ATCC 7050]AJH80062.1 bacterial regulatory, arsR family protein [Heyndrickxia coagulans DSM 1 = ATCC 7050]MCR2847332.1 ArsR family transcriptional regulator [Heyndrickxia coagulans]MDR4225641.1 ArsR family transcriptional regulator [Heyndrickxia coagulans DSM 1 = ATCC 7050]MED4492956.1 ArsR family transcriptional regulator [Heyndrickxia coagulans]